MERLKEFNENIQFLKQNYSKELAAFMTFIESVEKEGVLDKKTKELIALVVGMVKHCEWCIAYHVKAAKEAGATKQEIYEAAWIGVLMDGGPGLSYMYSVIKAVEELYAK